MSKINKGRHLSEETKEKMSIVKRKYWENKRGCEK